MKIAQVAPLYESVPPKFYGGTERVVSYLTEELVHEGHDVTLFASGDSKTSARLYPICDRALRLEGNQVSDPVAHHVRMIGTVAKLASEFDIIHFHIDYIHFPSTTAHRIPSLTTLHGRLDIPDVIPLYRDFTDINLVSISNAQRSPIPWANWVGTVYHGLPEDHFEVKSDPEGYLAFLGRFSPEKGVDRAVEIAKRVGIPLKIAAKVDKADKDYFETHIRKLLDDPLIEWVGEIGESEKSDFLGNARALLFPINWPEPFGLVMIEAMACGTPVIAYPRGSVPEVIEHGKTGFIVNSIEEAVAALDKLSGFDRNGCRREFVERFSASRMCLDYLDVYKRLLGSSVDGSSNGKIAIAGAVPGGAYSCQLTSSTSQK